MKPAHQRLDELMKARRFALGIRTWRALSERAGVSYETLRAVRAGGNPGEATEDGLERALEWQPGTIRTILAGSEPAPTGDVEESPRLPPVDPSDDELTEMIKDARGDRVLYEALMSVWRLRNPRAQGLPEPNPTSNDQSDTA